MLRAAQRQFVLQNQREISAGFVEKLFPGAERFYTLYREQFNPDLTQSDSVVEEWIPWERLEPKKKSQPSRNRLLIGRLPKKPDTDYQE
jgi:hypothetical protein